MGGPLSPQKGLVGEERPSTCLAGPSGEPHPELAARAIGAEQHGFTVLTLGDGTGACGVSTSGTHTPQPNEEPWAPNVAKPTGPSISRVGGQRQGRSHSSTGEGRGAATGGAGKAWVSPSPPGRATSPRGPIYMELKVIVTLKAGREATPPGGQPSRTQAHKTHKYTPRQGTTGKHARRMQHKWQMDPAWHSPGNTATHCGL
ncbi:uncharacterized protein LOC117018474 [Rhinolophus ferrumequinum]|uniref:uncharacterized protein LOC117018474 n=1 Tax=Rhinolophus ferrumequinum TaxID=59479 RepID=UPI00140FEC5E|nr:uncharacterized protein LOC117018474 [Rhinolophus ferrumequinum]